MTTTAAPARASWFPYRPAHATSYGLVETVSWHARCPHGTDVLWTQTRHRQAQPQCAGHEEAA